MIVPQPRIHINPNKGTWYRREKKTNNVVLQGAALLLHIRLQTRWDISRYAMILYQVSTFPSLKVIDLLFINESSKIHLHHWNSLDEMNIVVHVRKANKKPTISYKHFIQVLQLSILLIIWIISRRAVHRETGNDFSFVPHHRIHQCGDCCDYLPVAYKECLSESLESSFHTVHAHIIVYVIFQLASLRLVFFFN